MKRLIFIIIAIVTIGICPVWINFGHNWVSMDFVNQQIPFIIETKRMLSSGTPWWSWNTFVGDNFIGGYSFYTLTSPFVWLTCLFPYDKILWGILLSLYLKFICTGIFSYLYFRKMEFSSGISTLGALLYCFSSFYSANLMYFHFCEPIMMFPLLLIALEMVVRDNQRAYFWLALATFGTVFINFYFSLSSLLLGALYLLFRLYGERKLRWTIVLKAAGAVILGIGLTAFILFPVIFHNMGGSRSHPLLSIYFNPFSVIYENVNLIRSLIMPVISETKGDGFFQYEFSSVEPYLLLFGLFPTIIYILKYHKKRNWLTWFIIFLLICYLTPINGVFSGFTHQTYTRWIYGLNIMFILSLLYLLKNKNEFKVKDVVLYGVVSAFIILCCLTLDYLCGSIRFTLRQGLEMALFAFNFACLLIWVKRRCSVRVTIFIVAICGTLNLIATTSYWTKTRYYSSIGGQPEVDYLFRDVFAHTDYGVDRDVRYRIDVVSNYRNYSILNNIPGVFNFHSAMNKKLISLRNTIQDRSESPTFCALRNRESMDALFSVKNIMDFRDSLIYGVGVNRGLTLVKKFPDYDLYENQFYIPVGFTYDNYVTESEFKPYLGKSKDVDIPALILDNIVVKNEDETELGKYLNKGLINPSLSMDSLVTMRRRLTVDDFVGTTNGFSCTSDFDSTEVVFFSVVADDGFKAYIDGEQAKIYDVNLGLIGIVVPSGRHTIRFKYYPPGLKVGSIISLFFLALLFLVAYPPKSKFLMKRFSNANHSAGSGR